MAGTVTQAELYSEELQDRVDKGEFTLDDYRKAKTDGLLSHPLPESTEEGEPKDVKEPPKGATEQETKPEEGGKTPKGDVKDGGKETPKGETQETKPEGAKETPKGETQETKPADKGPGPGEQFAEQQKAAREQRRQERRVSQDQQRIQELERQLAEKEGRTGGPEVTGLTEEPKEDDPKYGGDIEAYWDDLDKWEAQGGKPVEVQPAGDTAQATKPPEKPPEKSRNDMMLDGIYEALDRIDEESKLTADFKQAITYGNIELSNEILLLLDHPETPDFIIGETARLFLEKPSLSGRIARRQNGSHREMLLSLLSEREKAANPPPEESPGEEEPFEALMGAGAEVQGQTIEDLLNSDDPDKYSKYRAWSDQQRQQAQ